MKKYPKKKVKQPPKTVFAKKVVSSPSDLLTNQQALTNRTPDTILSNP